MCKFTFGRTYWIISCLTFVFQLLQFIATIGMSEQRQVIITTNIKILSVLNASQVQRQEPGALLFHNIVMEGLVQP